MFGMPSLKKKLGSLTTLLPTLRLPSEAKASAMRLPAGLSQADFWPWDAVTS